MKKIEEIKNRFYQLLESEIGDVKPIMTEQNPQSSVYSLKASPDYNNTSVNKLKSSYYKTDTKPKSNKGIVVKPNMIIGGKTPTITASKINTSCISNTDFALATSRLIEEGLEPKFLKVALGIAKRETDFGQSLRYSTYGEFKNALNSLTFGLVDSSGGLTQVKPSTASRIGSDEDTRTPYGALKTTYMIIKDLYKVASSVGYSENSPSTNLSTGTGSAALDLALVGYNKGPAYIGAYCTTSNPKLKGLCSKQKNDNGDKINQKDVIKNYLPNYGQSPSSHGYVTEVSNEIKKYNCF